MWLAIAVALITLQVEPMVFLNGEGGEAAERVCTVDSLEPLAEVAVTILSTQRTFACGFSGSDIAGCAQIDLRQAATGIRVTIAGEVFEVERLDAVKYGVRHIGTVLEDGNYLVSQHDARWEFRGISAKREPGDPEPAESWKLPEASYPPLLRRAPVHPYRFFVADEDVAGKWSKALTDEVVERIFPLVRADNGSIPQRMPSETCDIIKRAASAAVALAGTTFKRVTSVRGGAKWAEVAIDFSQARGVVVDLYATHPASAAGGQWRFYLDGYGMGFDVQAVQAKGASQDAANPESLTQFWLPTPTSSPWQKSGSLRF